MERKLWNEQQTQKCALTSIGLLIEGLGSDTWQLQRSYQLASFAWPAPCSYRLLLPSRLIFFAQPSSLANETVDCLRPEMLCGGVLEYQRDVRKRHLRRVHSPGNTDLQL